MDRFGFEEGDRVEHHGQPATITAFRLYTGQDNIQRTIATLRFDDGHEIGVATHNLVKRDTD